ncbi:ankyrin repeat domain-containing protein [Pochonia chlamydosporia 170]|uniref:Ankyrin repeat domain-containing protein n=1 Tax=Pochonia chlamydosporia 170 TaxID=1380566 RepID=A0A179F408_METCM|nr:ankyrin repeat domain-containing protein [Pochonia chlamydosporia 170]OAQ60148.1 ankyrin repeat domain-containing protein [Pochonia chlamydosporia 170]
MSSDQIFEYITDIDALSKKLVGVFNSIKDLGGLPEVFQEVGNCLLIVRNALQAAETQAHNVEADKEAEALEDSLRSCKEKAEQLLEIVKCIKENKAKSPKAAYQERVVQLGKASRVETLLDNILKDLQVLAAHRAFKAALETQAEALDEGRKKLEQVAREKPSVPDSMFEEPSGTTNINYGRDQITNTVRGTQNNVKGHQFNANGNQSFGRIPEAPTQEPSESAKSSEGFPIDESRTNFDTFMNILPLTDPQEDIVKIGDRRAPDTCEWLTSLKIYEEWAGLNDRHPLWLVGPPGVGKTMLSCFLLEKLMANPKCNILAFYFCDNNDSRRNTATAILRGLLFQLIKAEPSFFFEKVKFQYGRHGQKFFDDTDALWSALLFILKRRDTGQIYLLLDALDECEEPSLSTFLAHLARTFGDKTATEHLNAQLLITSRPEDTINRRLRTITRYVYIGSDQVKPDLDRYIDWKVEGIKGSQNVQDLVRDNLKKKADGTFLWVHLIMHDLEGEDFGADEERATTALKLLPQGLPEVYDQILRKVKQRDQGRAKFVLQFIVAARRHLTVDELDMAYAIHTMARDSDHVPVRQDIRPNIYDCCEPIITFNVKTNTVSLVHQSAKEFLLKLDHVYRFVPAPLPTQYFLSVLPIPFIVWAGRHITFVTLSISTILLFWAWPSRASIRPSHGILSHVNTGEPWYRVKLDEANVLIFKICWRYLGVREFEGGAKIIQCNPERVLNPVTQPDELLEKYCFLGYGTNEWLEHADAARRALIVNPTWVRDNVDQMPTMRDYWLLMAAQRGDRSVMLMLVENGAYIGAKDCNERTALHLAAMSGYQAVVRELLEKGADVAAKSSKGWTALHLAAINGHEAVVRVLLDNGADTTVEDNSRRTALDWAIRGDHEAVAQALLERDGGVTIKGGDAKMVRLLFDVIERGKEELVQMLLENGADVTAKDNDGWTALHLAVALGHEGVVRVLLENGADVTAKHNDGWTALHLAAMVGHDGVVRAFLENGADVTAKDDDGRTALRFAAATGHEGVVRELLENGADVTAKSNDGLTALQGAARIGHKEVVQVLLENGADVAAKDNDEWTALHLAAMVGHEGVVQVLLKNGADVTAKDDDGRTALQSAAMFGHEGVLRMLLENRADVDAKSHHGWTALHWAAATGHIMAVRVLLENEANVATKDNTGWTALCLTPANDQEGIRRLLRGVTDAGDRELVPDQEQGPLLNQQDATQGDGICQLAAKDVAQQLLRRVANSTRKMGTTIELTELLIHAALTANEAWVRALLELGADVTGKDDDEETALHVAARMGHEVVVRVLLENGADVSAKSNDGRTALHIAAKYGYEGVLRVLLENGAGVSAKSNDRRTALHIAATYGYEGAVRVLLENGADVAETCAKGQTALHLSASNGREGVTRVLLEKGANVAMKDDDGETARSLAVFGGYKALERLLDQPQR